MKNEMCWRQMCYLVLPYDAGTEAEGLRRVVAWHWLGTDTLAQK